MKLLISDDKKLSWNPTLIESYEHSNESSQICVTVLTYMNTFYCYIASEIFMLLVQIYLYTKLCFRKVDKFYFSL